MAAQYNSGGSRWAPLILVLAVACCAVATTALYVNGQPDVYTSSAVVSLSPRDTLRVGADNLSLAASRYVASLSAPTTLAAVAKQIGESPEDVAAGTEVLIQPNTVNIQIKVTLEQPERTALIANAIAAEGVRRSRTDGLVYTELVVPAVVPAAPSGPRRKLILLGGAGAAAGLSVLAIAALGYFRDASILGGPDTVRITPSLG